MAVKGVALVTEILQDDPSGFKCTVKWIGLDGTSSYEDSLQLTGVSPSVSAATLESNIKAAVKTAIENAGSITFDVLDSVRLIGALL